LDRRSCERLGARESIHRAISADDQATDRCVILREAGNWPAAMSL
jgi:hypothetical protein